MPSQYSRIHLLEIDNFESGDLEFDNLEFGIIDLRFSI
mgnify:CR=1 FL=1